MKIRIVRKDKILLDGTSVFSHITKQLFYKSTCIVDVQKTPGAPRSRQFLVFTVYGENVSLYGGLYSGQGICRLSFHVPSSGEMWPSPLNPGRGDVESLGVGRMDSMKRRFTDQQNIAMIREQEAGLKTSEVCRKHGISDATF